MLSPLPCSLQACSPVQVSVAPKSPGCQGWTPATSVSCHSNTQVGLLSCSVCQVLFFCFCHRYISALCVTFTFPIFDFIWFHYIFSDIAVTASKCTADQSVWLKTTKSFIVQGTLTYCICMYCIHMQWLSVSSIPDIVFINSVVVCLLRWWNLAAGLSVLGNSGSSRTGTSLWARRPPALTAPSGETSHTWVCYCPMSDNIFYLPLKLKQG